MSYIKKLFTLAIGATKLIGIPYFFSAWGLIFVSWLPAMFAMIYLED